MDSSANSWQMAWKQKEQEYIQMRTIYNKNNRVLYVKVSKPTSFGEYCLHSLELCKSILGLDNKILCFQLHFFTARGRGLNGPSRC